VRSVHLPSLTVSSTTNDWTQCSSNIYSIQIHPKNTVSVGWILQHPSQRMQKLRRPHRLRHILYSNPPKEYSKRTLDSTVPFAKNAEAAQTPQTPTHTLFKSTQRIQLAYVRFYSTLRKECRSCADPPTWQAVFTRSRSILPPSSHNLA
jgi:hypothetical protein